MTRVRRITRVLEPLFRAVLLVSTLSGLAAGMIGRGTARAQSVARELVLSGDANLLWADLAGDPVQDENGRWTGEIVIENRHPLWYVVVPTVTVPRGLPKPDLPPLLLLPPCRVKPFEDGDLAHYDCTDTRRSLGTQPLSPRMDLALFADGSGATDQTLGPLMQVYGAELFWRFVLHDELPTDFGDALQDLAFEAASKTEVAAEVSVPLATFYNLGKAIRDHDAGAAAGAIKDALKDKAFRDWLVHRWPGLEGPLSAAQAVAGPIEEVKVGVVMLELPLYGAIEEVPGVGAPYGAIHAQVPNPFVHDGEFIKGTDETIYVVSNDRKRAFPDFDTFLSDGGNADLSNVLSLSDDEIVALNSDAPLDSVHSAPASLGAVHGRVIGDRNDTPVAGATVTLKDAAGHTKTARTASDGTYAFTEVVPGDAWLTGRAPRAVDYGLGVNVASGATTVATDLWVGPFDPPFAGQLAPVPSGIQIVTATAGCSQDELCSDPYQVRLTLDQSWSVPRNGISRPVLAPFDGEFFEVVEIHGQSCARFVQIPNADFSALASRPPGTVSVAMLYICGLEPSSVSPSLVAQVVHRGTLLGSAQTNELMLHMTRGRDDLGLPFSGPLAFEGRDLTPAFLGPGGERTYDRGTSGLRWQSTNRQVPG